MKTIVSIITAVGLLASAGTVQADHHEQEESPLFLIFELMRVEPGNGSAYLETEDFWSGIHQQRANADEIIGWDLWSLEPSGTDQGYQYVTVTLFSSMQSMMEPVSTDQLIAHAKAAYPDLEDEQVTAKFNATVDSRDLGIRMFLERIDTTTGGPSMKVGTVATFDYMKAKDSSYESWESEFFKPRRQQWVDDGKQSSWGLVRVILPYGTESYASHITVNMYEDIGQMTKVMQSGPGELSAAQEAALQEGLDSRDMKSVHLGRLVKMVRKQ